MRNKPPLYLRGSRLRESLTVENNHNDAKGMADACRKAWGVFRTGYNWDILAFRNGSIEDARYFVDILHKHEAPELREAIAQELVNG